MKSKRESNYDLLRILACIAVVMIHVSATYFGAVVSDSVNVQYDTTHVGVISFYNGISRFAVPSFVMLSGAFILANDRNENYRYFYKKTFINIGIPMIVFSALYVAYAMLKKLIEVIVLKEGVVVLLEPIEAALKGKPFSHMWYLYMMLGVYALVPIVIKVKKELGERVFARIAVIFLLLAMLSAWTSSHELKWDIGFSFCYLGYFMMGYVIRQRSTKDTRKGLLLIICGIVIELVVCWLRYQQVLGGLTDAELKHGLVEDYNPLVVVAAICLFAGFSRIEIKKDLGKLSGLTFLIYLIHAVVWDIGSKLIGALIGKEGDARIIIPVSVIVVFYVAAGLSKIYQWLWYMLEKKFELSTRLCKKIGF